jgi:trk system potassium uptake protein TrkA
MRILIVGAGRMGFALAEEFDAAGHEVYLVDTRPERVELARTRLDVMAVRGSGCSIGLLRTAGAKGADLLLAVSGSDEVNTVACLIGRELGIRRRIARIESRDLAENMRELAPSVLAVDEVVNPREVTVSRLEHIVRNPRTTMSAEFEGGRLVMRGLRVEAESPLTRAPLAELHAPLRGRFLVTLVMRGDDLLVPTGDFLVERGDTIFVVLAEDQLEAFLQTFGFPRTQARRVFVYGASEIGLDICHRLSGEVRDVVLLDEELDACHAAGHELDGISIVHGSPLEKDLMTDLKIESADAFLGLSGDGASNLTSALLARRLGVGISVMLTETPEHVALFDTMALDAVLNPATLSVGAILRQARAGAVLSLFKIAGNRGEALEVEAERGGRAVGKPLRDVHFPPGSVVASVSGPEGVRLPSGDTVVAEGERVVLVALRESIADALKLFSAR